MKKILFSVVLLLSMPFSVTALTIDQAGNIDTSTNILGDTISAYNHDTQAFEHYAFQNVPTTVPVEYYNNSTWYATDNSTFGGLIFGGCSPNDINEYASFNCVDPVAYESVLFSFAPVVAPTGTGIAFFGTDMTGGGAVSALGANVSSSVGSIMPIAYVVMGITLAFFILMQIMKMFGFVDSRKSSFFFATEKVKRKGRKKRVKK